MLWCYDITFENILKYSIVIENIKYILYHIWKVYKSNFSKIKLTDSHYLSDKKHNDSKLCQKKSKSPKSISHNAPK